MSAAEYLHPQQFHQLAMFMTAGEIKSTHTPNDAYRMGTRVHSDSDLWEKKKFRANIDGLSRRIEEQKGVERPVKVEDPVYVNQGGKPRLWDGHHRVAASEERNPKALLPVEYHPSFRSAFKDRYS